MTLAALWGSLAYGAPLGLGAHDSGRFEVQYPLGGTEVFWTEYQRKLRFVHVYNAAQDGACRPERVSTPDVTLNTVILERARMAHPSSRASERRRISAQLMRCSRQLLT